MRAHTHIRVSIVMSLCPSSCPCVHTHLYVSACPHSPGLQRWKPHGAAGIRQGSTVPGMGKHIHGLPLLLLLPMTYPNKLEPWVIQQQQNQTKNNLLVLMGLVLSLPRTFQPGSRDRSGGGGEGDDNEAKLFLRLQMSELSAVPLAGSGAAAGPWRCRGEAEHPRSTARDRHFPFPGLHYFLEREPRWPGREGLRFPACLFARPCVLLPGEERSQAGRGKLGCVAVVWLGGWEPGSPMCRGGGAALAPPWSHPWFQGDDMC